MPAPTAPPIGTATLLYERTFAPGNSDFTALYNGSTQTPGFFQRWSPPGDDGADALYPDMFESKDVTVETGTGPGGVNVLTLHPSAPLLSGNPYWGEMGIRVNIPVVSATTNNTSVGAGVTYPYTTHVYAEVEFKPVAAAFVAGGIRKILAPGGAEAAHFSPFTEMEFARSSGIWGVEITVQSLTGSNLTRHYEWIAIPGSSGGIVNGNWQKMRVDIDHSSAPGVADGELSFWWDKGAGSGYELVKWLENIVVDSGHATAGTGVFTNANIGRQGLPGPVSAFRIYSLAEAEPEPIEPPPVVGLIPECCDPAGPSVSPAPIGPLPPWASSCAGGGVVDSVADLTDGEVWG